MPGRAELALGTLLGLVLAGPTPAAEPAPDAGFLEFLGLLVENEGEYLDPLDMADIRLPEDDGSEQEWPDGEQDPHADGDGALPETDGALEERGLENDHEHDD